MNDQGDDFNNSDSDDNYCYHYDSGDDGCDCDDDCKDGDGCENGGNYDLVIILTIFISQLFNVHVRYISVLLFRQTE